MWVGGDELCRPPGSRSPHGPVSARGGGALCRACVHGGAAGGVGQVRGMGGNQLGIEGGLDGQLRTREVEEWGNFSTIG